MQPAINNPGPNTALAIAAGIVATFLAGLVMYPLVTIVFENYFEMDFSGGRALITRNDLILFFTILLWVLIAAITGGLVSAVISRGKEYHHAWIMTAILTGILLLLVLADLDSFDPISAIFFVAVVAMMAAGYHIGTKAGIRIKKRKAVSNNSSSPPGNQ